MVERRNPTKAEIGQAWINSGGKLDWKGDPTGFARCASKYCQHKNSLLVANDYGSNYELDWVVDHKIPLSKNGGWNSKNLQAMHNICNAEKGDDIY